MENRQIMLSGLDMKFLEIDGENRILSVQFPKIKADAYDKLIDDFFKDLIEQNMMQFTNVPIRGLKLSWNQASEDE